MIEITMKKYEHDLLTFCADLVGRELTKAARDLYPGLGELHAWRR